MSLGSSSPIVPLVDDDVSNDVSSGSNANPTVAVTDPNAVPAALNAVSSGSNANPNAADVAAVADTTAVPNDVSSVSGDDIADVTDAIMDAATAPPPNVASTEPSMLPDFINSAVSTIASTASSIQSNIATAAAGVAAAAGLSSASEEKGAAALLDDDAMTPEARTANMNKVALEKDILTEFELNEREKIEKGLQEFNQLLLSNPFGTTFIGEIERAIENAYPKHVLIKLTQASSPIDSFSGPAIVSYCNPSISGLSDFVPHYNLFVLTKFEDGTHIHLAMDAIHDFFLKDVQANKGTGFKLKASFVPGPGISLRLHIGEVFNIPIFTVHVMDSVFDTSRLPGALIPIEPQPFIHNAKPIGPYNQLDLVMELLIGQPDDEPYAQVNPIVARGMNELCVKRFLEGAETSPSPSPSPSPNAVIQQMCDGFFELTSPTSTIIRKKIIKNALIAILQNPVVQTSENMKFSDIFPSGQYASYFDEIAHRCDSEHVTGPLTVRMAETSFPLTRTSIIVAALTAVNSAMKNVKGGHIVAGGGAAVSYYIQNFLTDADANLFNEDVIRMAGLENIEQLVESCNKIPMNDIDCFVFGEVSRQFLMVFSLYMMILYDNFYERPKRYHKMDALETQVKKFRFKLKASSDDHIDLFMYGNRNNDANTKLISKRLKKNPKVQLVTQETKCFSQIVHPMCNSAVAAEEASDDYMCREDEYFMQPIDLVKKDIQEFIELYTISLYRPDGIPPPGDLDDMIQRQYTSDNMVSMKTTMLDIICIFCDEGKSLFIRIFMARKNPKDFTRLRVFMDLYLLQLLRSKQSNAEQFSAVNDDFIAAVGKLREKMAELNTSYYLEQGNLAAIQVETAEKLNADRTEFLTMLRDIGRRVVAFPDPFDDRVPIAFQSTMGVKIIDFFKKSRTMKYRFSMPAHMKQLVSMYHKTPSPPPIDCYRWLDKVFDRIKFARDTETFFQSILEKIMTTMNNPAGNYEIGFKYMPVRSSLMLRLHDALKSAKPHEDIFNQFSLMFGQLLRPIREHVARHRTFPTAQYVGISDGVYDLDKKRRLFPTFVKDVILLSEAKHPENLERVELLKLISELNGRKNAYNKYDDEVKEEIGRIILEYAHVFIDRLRGGGGGISIRKTRRQRRRRLANANTRGHVVSNEGANTRKRKHRRPRITRRVAAL